MKRLFSTGIVLLFLAGKAGADPRIDLSGGVSWERMELRAQAALNLGRADIRLPSGRSQAEELIHDAFPALIQPSLLSLPVDSSSTVGDLIDRGELTLNGVGHIAMSAKRFPPALSQDLSSLSAGYSVDLALISSSLIRHRHTADIPRTLLTASGGNYTGIIIFADQELPVHGRNISASTLPCLFPKIWDSDMNLIYQKNMVESEKARDGIVRYTSSGKVFMPSPSGLDSSLENFVGPNPLRILARSVYGERPTDPVIDRSDALLIIASEENRQLLREGRVVIVLNSAALASPLAAE
ncbi:MAG: polymerase [Spirochaetaceae bacterium]|jgi:hypothetical protein|nr:polymerase [Spirochaetaceae bacterium]